MEKRPNVFPTSTQQPQTQEELPKVKVDSDYEAQKLLVADEVYQSSANETGMAAIEAMRQRTEEQMRLRDAQLKKNQEQTQSYQDKMAYANERTVNTQQVQPEPPTQKPVYKNEIKSPITSINLPSMTQVDPYIQQLSQPQFNTSFDVLPLPSEGKLYKNKKPNVKVAYMTAADENILTSPNLLQSGEFLEILINRKLLETDIRYRDLHVGDRNAIMLWLRATSYGEMYPVTIFDENDTPFDTEVNLNELKTIKLGAEPDAEGYFDLLLPVSKINVKFKLLTVGDLEDIQKKLDIDEENKVPVNYVTTYTLEKQLVEVDGNRDKNMIREFVQNMRLRDSKELKEYSTKIESGIDLDIEVGTPGGGSIKTFLPLNIKFFWPNFSV